MPFWYKGMNAACRIRTCPPYTDDLRFPTGYLSNSVKTTYSTSIQERLRRPCRAALGAANDECEWAALDSNQKCKLPRIYNPLRYQFRSPALNDSYGALDFEPNISWLRTRNPEPLDEGAISKE